jgi:hypothetical protein
MAEGPKRLFSLSSSVVLLIFSLVLAHYTSVLDGLFWIGKPPPAAPNPLESLIENDSVFALNSRSELVFHRNFGLNEFIVKYSNFQNKFELIEILSKISEPDNPHSSLLPLLPVGSGSIYDQPIEYYNGTSLWDIYQTGLAVHSRLNCGDFSSFLLGWTAYNIFSISENFIIPELALARWGLNSSVKIESNPSDGTLTLSTLRPVRAGDRVTLPGNDRLSDAWFYAFQGAAVASTSIHRARFLFDARPVPAHTETMLIGRGCADGNHPGVIGVWASEAEMGEAVVHLVECVGIIQMTKIEIQEKGLGEISDFKRNKINSKIKILIKNKIEIIHENFHDNSLTSIRLIEFNLLDKLLKTVD